MLLWKKIILIFNCIYYEEDYFDRFSYYGFAHSAICEKYKTREIAE